MGSRLRLDGLWIVALEQVQADASPAHALPAQRYRDLLKVFADWIDIGRIPQTKFEIDRCGDTNQFRDLIQAHEAAEIVGYLQFVPG